MTTKITDATVEIVDEEADGGTLKVDFAEVVILDSGWVGCVWPGNAMGYDLYPPRRIHVIYKDPEIEQDNDQ